MTRPARSGSTRPNSAIVSARSLRRAALEHQFGPAPRRVAPVSNTTASHASATAATPPAPFAPAAPEVAFGAIAITLPPAILRSAIAIRISWVCRGSSESRSRMSASGLAPAPVGAAASRCSSESRGSESATCPGPRAAASAGVGAQSGRQASRAPIMRNVAFILDSSVDLTIDLHADPRAPAETPHLAPTQAPRASGGACGGRISLDDRGRLAAAAPSALVCAAGQA